MILKNDSFAKFLTIKWNNKGQITDFVNNTPFIEEPFCGKDLYQLLYNALSKDEKEIYEVIATPQNLIILLNTKKQVLNRLSNELDQWITKYYMFADDFSVQKDLLSILDKETESIIWRPLFREENKLAIHSNVKPECKTLREYMFYNLSHYINNEGKYYFCTHCHQIIHVITNHQIAAFKKSGTILHTECRKPFFQLKRSQNNKNKKNAKKIPTKEEYK